MSYVAFQYAEALYSLALEKNQVSNVKSDYTLFTNALDEEVYKFLNHPKIPKEDKKAVINSALENKLLRNFVNVLIDNSRVELLEDVLTEYSKIVNNQNKILEVKAYTGKKLTSEQKAQIIANLSKKYNRKIELELIVDESIVGGLRLEYEGNVHDDTINNYLHGLKANLTK